MALSLYDIDWLKRVSKNLPERKLAEVKEETDNKQIDELSKPLLKRYIKGRLATATGAGDSLIKGTKKAAKYIPKAVHRVGGKYYPKHAMKTSFKGHRVYHAEGEETDNKQIDELSRKTLSSYEHKARRKRNKISDEPGMFFGYAKKGRKLGNLDKGVYRAGQRLRGKMPVKPLKYHAEEIEGE